MTLVSWSMVRRGIPPRAAVLGVGAIRCKNPTNVSLSGIHEGATAIMEFGDSFGNVRWGANLFAIHSKEPSNVGHIYA